MLESSRRPTQLNLAEKGITFSSWAITNWTWIEEKHRLGVVSLHFQQFLNIVACTGNLTTQLKKNNARLEAHSKACV